MCKCFPSLPFLPSSPFLSLSIFFFPPSFHFPLFSTFLFILLYSHFLSFFSLFSLSLPFLPFLFHFLFSLPSLFPSPSLLSPPFLSIHFLPSYFLPSPFIPSVTLLYFSFSFNLPLHFCFLVWWLGLHPMIPRLLNKGAAKIIVNKWSCQGSSPCKTNGLPWAIPGSQKHYVLK